MKLSTRILYITRVWPQRGISGGEVRSRSILRALQDVGSVETLVLDEEGRCADMPPEPTDEFPVSEALNVERMTHRRLSLQKLRWTVDPQSNYPYGFGVGTEAFHSVFERSKNFDLVWFWTLRSPDMFPTVRWKSSVVDIDDVPSTLEQTKLKVSRGLRDKLLTYRRVVGWQRRESMLDRRFSILAVCSNEDKRYLRSRGVERPVYVIPNGFQRPAAEPDRAPVRPPRLGFIGVMNHLPNQDGLHWFTEACWGRIKSEIPDARLRLMGPGTDGPLKPHGPDIDSLGWVQEPLEEIRTWSAVIVPIRIGAGTRVKIAQAFRYKCPVVSTTFGAQGYEAAHRDGMYIADEPEAFTAACVSAIRNPSQATKIAEQAWSLYLNHWTWDAIYPQVWAAAENCLRLSSPGR